MITNPFSLLSNIQRFIPAAAIYYSTVFALIATQLQADVNFPTGLAPGSQYEIAFVTADVAAAVSANIEDYNNFVTVEANQDSKLAGLGVSWKVIGSTPTVNAIDNAPNNGSIPVFNTAGQLVANAATNLYSGKLINAINFTQTGALNTNYTVWTGTDLLWSGINGTADPAYPLGSTPIWAGGSLPPANMEADVIVGLSQVKNYRWLNYDGTALTAYDSSYNPPDIQQYPLYALSSPITVPPAVPNLIIIPSGANSIVIVWPITGNYTLQTNNNLNTSNWIGYGGPVATANGTNSVTITPSATGSLFFRLSNQ